MNVLSLFDGISCARLALDRAEIKYDKYYASEIDKYALKIAMKNYPDTIQLGDVTQIDFSKLPKIDLVCGGSPCQGFSFAGKQLNFNDPRSKLFFEFVRAVKTLKPKYFLLENVKMKKEYQEVINELLGVTPIEINSALVSAQNRRRLYWTNIQGVEQPEDKKIYLKDIIESGEVDRQKSFCLDANYWKGGNLKSYFEKNRRQLVFNSKDSVVMFLNDNKRVKGINENSRGYRPHRGDFKSTGISELGRILKPIAKTDSITTSHAPKIALNADINNLIYRKLTTTECERLQALPDNWTEGISKTQRYKCIGNAWTVDVVAHIFRNIK